MVRLAAALYQDSLSKAEMKAGQGEGRPGVKSLWPSLGREGSSLPGTMAMFVCSLTPTQLVISMLEMAQYPTDEE